MSNVLRMITFKIRDIRQIELKERRRLINYDKLNPDPNSRAAAKSACKTQIYECKIFVHKALQLNLHICECLAKMQNNESVMRTGNINLSTQMNVRRLLSPVPVKEHFNEFVYKRPPKPFPQDVQLRLQHGSTHEVQCITQLVT